jgi:DNA-binding GntR family transcriptional regulator
MVTKRAATTIDTPPGSAAVNGEFSAKPESQTQLTLQAADRIRELIVRHVLLPGEKIRQVELAERVGVSRSPLREALRTLESEGIVAYEANRGYVVSRLDAGDLAQIYRMRELLETELLGTLAKPKAEEIRNIVRQNERMAEAMAAGNVSEALSANRDFHFAIFELSSLDLFQKELRRLWQLSEGYRATYLWLPETQKRVVLEHGEIISALRKYDLEKVVEFSARHRAASKEVVIALLALS